MRDSETIKVLLLEDNPDDVFLLRNGLNKNPVGPVDLIHVERLSEAVEVIQDNSIDVVLTDLNLPDSAGKETIERLSEAAKNIPILVLTASDDKLFGAQLVSAGAFSYLSKDRLNSPEVFNAIQSALQRGS